jgi:quinol monooxygenase YgiN
LGNGRDTPPAGENGRYEVIEKLEVCVNPECTLIAYLHAKPEKRGELLRILEGFVKPTRSEAGCVSYHLHVSDNDPNFFVFYENWRTRKDLDEHLRMPYLADFWSKRLDFLTKDVELQFVKMLSEFQE